MRFSDRLEAGQLLGQRLSAYRGQRPLVLAIPRGGVPVGRGVADALEGELDVVLIEPLSAPGNPQLTIGFLSEGGQVEFGPIVVESKIRRDHLDREIRLHAEVIQRRRTAYSRARGPSDPAHRTVIVVDDGRSAGVFILAALRAVRARHPRRMVVALPVVPEETLARLEGCADEVVCLLTPKFFGAAGRFYENFPSVTDDQVVEGLAEAGREPCEPQEESWSGVP